jgi:tetratricopeptide (TPR) repeat protein
MYETARQATLLRSISAIISHVLNEKQRLTIESYNYAIHRVFYLRMKLRCFCALPLILLVGPLFGANDETAWKHLITEAVRAQEQGQFASAEIAYNSAMDVAGQITNNTVYQAITANNLALLYHHHGDFVLSEKHYLAALSISRGSNDRRMEQLSAENLASLYLEIGQTSKAANLLRPFIPDDIHVDADNVVLLTDLGSIRVRQNRLDDAERLLRAVIRFLEDRHDVANQDAWANALNNLAAVFSLTGRLPEAVVYSRRALTIFENLPQGYADDLVRGLVNLAVVTASADVSSESAELFRRAIATSESALGPEHPLLAEVLTRYAQFLRIMKRNADARKAEQRARQIQTKSPHENSLGYTIDVNALAAQSSHQRR